MYIALPLEPLAHEEVERCLCGLAAQLEGLVNCDIWVLSVQRKDSQVLGAKLRVLYLI